MKKNEIIFKIPKHIINGISLNDFKKLNIKIPELKLIDSNNILVADKE